jgi:ubiquitin carboxyl-terminal hydrolase 5/13
VTSVTCYSCPRSDVDKTLGKLPAVIEGVMTAMTFSKREEVKAWEQEFIPCEHTLCLAQEEVEDAESKGMHTLLTIRLAIDGAAHVMQILANVRHAN